MTRLLPMRSFGAKLTFLVTATTGVAVLMVAAILAAIDYIDTKTETEVLASAETNIIAVNSEAPLAFGDPELGREALGALRAAHNVALARLYAPDVAILPIGGHFTMDPKEAAVACELLGVKRCIPCHYGTFPILAGTPDELRELAPGVEVIAPEPGGSVEL